ncbi:hypothetical protein [Sinorhizobium meliloti]|uniref:hypothetical protein n=1 Tax=Rhizobium meliloti TaxID=382 RepID=UPI00299F3CDB
MPNLERVNEAAKQAVQTRFTSLDALHTAIMSQRVNWVLDADIRSFFDSVDHEWLLRCCITSIRLPFTGHLDDRSGRQAQVSMG